jgi:hypothetical protein
LTLFREALISIYTMEMLNRSDDTESIQMQITLAQAAILGSDALPMILEGLKLHQSIGLAD